MIAAEHYARGNALRLSGDIAAAEAELRRALALDPVHHDAAWSLAHLLREAGRYGAAMTVVCDLWKHASFGADAVLAALGFLLECSAHLQAWPLVHEARQHWPHDARIAARAGEIALALGAFDEAAEHLRAALDLDPRHGAAWLRLAQCQRFTSADDADVRRFARAAGDSALDAPARGCAGFAYAKALDDLGEYARAVAALRAANASARAAQSWDSDAWQRFVAQRLSAASLPARSASDDFVPVFIVGLPRTGTTLVAGTLTRFADVRTRGELNWIDALFAHLQEQNRLREPDALTAVANLIRAHMVRDDAPARFYIDKNPLNFRYLDFITALFPQAKIVHCRRNACATALSLWMQHFAHEDLSFAYDFANIAAFAHGYRRLMTHWRNVLRGSILDIDYEDFVQHPERERLRLGAFLGAPLAQSPGDGPDAITTASVWQARQPVHTGSVERWRRYIPFLPELARFTDNSAP